jgi:hypothetical protein
MKASLLICDLIQVRKTPLDRVEVGGGIAAGIHKEGGRRGPIQSIHMPSSLLNLIELCVEMFGIHF